MRLLVWIAFIALVYMALRSRAYSLRNKLREDLNAQFDAQRAQGQSPYSTPNTSSAENMVCCSYCSIYLPASEALTNGHTHNGEQEYFCSTAHLQAHRDTQN